MRPGSAIASLRRVTRSLKGSNSTVSTVVLRPNASVRRDSTWPRTMGGTAIHAIAMSATTMPAAIASRSKKRRDGRNRDSADGSADMRKRERCVLPQSAQRSDARF